MKTIAILAVLAAASVSAQTYTPCDASVLGPLVVDPNLPLCTAESGLAIPPVGVIPAEVLAKACKSTACAALLNQVLSFKVGNCAVGSFRLETDLINPVKKACPAMLGGGSTAGSSGGASAKAEVTTAPVAKSSTSGSSAASPKEQTPSATKTVPSPAPAKSNGAGVAAVTTSAVVAAVAASLW